MSPIDSLPPQQRAVLSLVLQKGRSYTEIAAMLEISEAAVRDRANAALEVLVAPSEPPLPPAHRYEIGDYLLGQQSTSESQHTLAFLAENVGARAWASALADEIRPIASFELPGIPGGGPTTRRATPPRPATSRRGGASLLLGLLGIAILIAVVALLSHKTGSTNTFKPTPAGATSSTGSTGAPPIQQQINLNPPGPHSKARGVAYVVLDNHTSVLVIQAQGLRANNKSRPAYAVWLYNNHHDAERLGYAARVTTNGKLAAYAAVPTNAARYRMLIVTIEYVARAKRPGPIMLSGKLPA